MTDTENRLALARGFNHESVSEHNERVLRFPDRLLAPLAGLARREHFAAEDFERATVPVNLQD